jgi:hypothetical protein
MLELADGAVVGYAPGFAGGLDARKLGAHPVIEDLENLRLPTTVRGLRHHPEPASADVYLSGHSVCITLVSAEVAWLGIPALHATTVLNT